MKKTACITLLSVLALGGLTTSCDEEYVSSPPIFSGFNITVKNDNYTPDSTTYENDTITNDTLYTNTKIAVTAVQRKKGHLLYKASYTWATSPSEGVNHTYQKGVIYDNENHNPTDTIIFTQPGKYTITFSGKYNISAADFEKVNGVEKVSDNEKITYTSLPLYYTIEIQKGGSKQHEKIIVIDRPTGEQ